MEFGIGVVGIAESSRDIRRRIRVESSTRVKDSSVSRRGWKDACLARLARLLPSDDGSVGTSALEGEDGDGKYLIFGLYHHACTTY